MKNERLYTALLWASVVLNCAAGAFSLVQSLRLEFAIREARELMGTFGTLGGFQ